MKLLIEGWLQIGTHFIGKLRHKKYYCMISLTAANDHEMSTVYYIRTGRSSKVKWISHDYDCLVVVFVPFQHECPIGNTFNFEEIYHF